MAQIKFHISNYHAVGCADIDLDGITVLAGINGSGKSTVGRWLYYTVNELNQFENDVISDYATELESLVKKWQRTVPNPESAPQNITENIRGWAERFAARLSSTLAHENNIDNKIRIANYIGIPHDSNDVAQAFISHANKEIEQLKQHFSDVAQRRDKIDFINTLVNSFAVTEQCPRELSLKEDNVEILQSSVGTLLTLKSAIYIDTPMFLAVNGDNSVFWRDVRSKMTTPSATRHTANRKLLEKIRKILDGRFEERQNPYLGTMELNFVSDNAPDIQIKDVATGYKTFAYIQRLIENGHLGDDSILIIDEPEAHLHPRWIFEYARILVLLHKAAKTKIMVATHSPDMVSALQQISDVEGVSNNVNFYLAKQNLSGKFDYKNTGTEIGEIFDEFNIAIDKVREYGQNPL